MALTFFKPVSNISPFTYRDGETYLEQLARLRDWIDELATLSSAQFAEIVNQFDDGMAEIFTASVDARNLAATILVADDSDNHLDAINEVLTATSPLGILNKRLVGNFTISGTIIVPANVYLDLSNATITQTASNVVAVILRAGATIYGGKIIGKTTDYVARTGSFTPVTVGVRVEGNDAVIRGTEFIGIGDTTIWLSNGSARPRIENVKITGPHNRLGMVIPDQDAGSIGIMFGTGVVDAVIRGLIVTNISIGVLGSYDSTGLTINDVVIKDIPGQHGIYLQNAQHLTIDNVRGSNVALNLIKVQLAAVSIDQSRNARVSNVSGTTIGDAVLMMYNTDTNMATGRKFVNVNVSNINGYVANRVVYLSNIQGGSVSSITGLATVQAVVTVLDCQDLVIDNVSSRVSGREVITFSNASAVASTGSSTQRITVSNVRGYNPCSANDASYVAGILISNPSAGMVDNASITLDGIEIESDQSTGASTYMRFGLLLNASVAQETIRVRNFRAKGWSNNPASLATATKIVGEWANVETGANVANFPSTLLTRIGTIGTKTQWACSVTPAMGVVQAGDVIHNTAPIAGGPSGWVAIAGGALFKASWTAALAVSTGEWYRTAAGRVFEATTGGTTGSVEPTATVVGGTFVDGSVTWICRSLTISSAKAMPNIAA